MTSLQKVEEERVYLTKKGYKKLNAHTHTVWETKKEEWMNGIECEFIIFLPKTTTKNQFD